MITFYVVRHGETLFNLKHLMQGWCDSPLTPKGSEQALSLGRGLSNIPFLGVYSSSSERAIDTAKLVMRGREEYALIPMKGLRETHFGAFQGEHEYIGRLKDEALRMRHGWIDVGGEDLAMTAKRMFRSMEEIAQQYHESGIILIMTHGGSILSLAHALRADGMQDMFQAGCLIENCSVNVLLYEHGKFTMEELNNKTYLK